MNIGIYLQTWHVGGVATFCQRLAYGLRKLGHSPCLILATPYGKRDEAGRLAYERLVQAAPSPIHCLHLNAFHPRERGWRAAELIARLNCEAIFLSSHQAVLEALPFLRRTAALIGIAHTDDPDSYADFCRAEPSCAAYVGVSNAILEALQSRRKVLPPEAIHRIPYGVAAAPGLAPPPVGAARILTVCRLVRGQKRVLDLPPIWRQYVTKGGTGTLTLCGPGEEATRLRRAFAEEIRRGRVMLTGAVPIERMAEVYGAHDILLNVSAYEGLPLVVLEAAMAGLYPLVSRTRSGHPEILECLGEGRLCEIGDIDGFATALHDLSLRLDFVRAVRPRLRERVQAHYSLSRMVDSYAQLATEAGRGRSPLGLQFADGELQLPRPTVDVFRRLVRRWQYGRHYGWRRDAGNRRDGGRAGG